MGQTEQVEEKLKLDMDITALKREHKNLVAMIGGIKSEYASTFSIVENNKKLIEEQSAYLSEIQNDISNAKLNWLSERESQMVEITEMKSAAQNILNRKTELNDQEEKIRQIELNTIDVRNETRRLELKVKGDETALEVREKVLLEAHKKLETEKAKLSKDKENFKNKVVAVLKEIETL